VHRFRCTTRGRLLVCHALHTAAWSHATGRIR
jgi:hypothetical protein